MSSPARLVSLVTPRHFRLICPGPSPGEGRQALPFEEHIRGFVDPCYSRSPSRPHSLGPPQRGPLLELGACVTYICTHTYVCHFGLPLSIMSAM